MSETLREKILAFLNEVRETHPFSEAWCECPTRWRTGMDQLVVEGRVERKPVSWLKEGMYKYRVVR